MKNQDINKHLRNEKPVPMIEVECNLQQKLRRVGKVEKCQNIQRSRRKNMDLTKYHEILVNHYSSVWKNTPSIHYWNKGPVNELPKGFSILKFKPTKARNMWTYATCGMSLPTDPNPLELHLFALNANDDLVELLIIVAHYHRTGSMLVQGHTINFGQPWWNKSKCEYGLISLPYLDGPSLEWLNTNEIKTQFLWLIPITKKEVEYKMAYGLEAIEEKFDNPNFNYVDPLRQSVI